MHNVFVSWCTALCAGWLLATPAVAITISDPDSDFIIEYEPGDLGLFGTPSLSNNVIFFTPTTFSAVSTDGEGTVATASAVTLRLISNNPLFLLSEFLVQEAGDYALDGDGTSVSVSGGISVFDPDDPGSIFSASLFPSDLTEADGELHDWIASGLLDSASGYTAVSEVVLTLDNLLEATTMFAFTSALVEKKFAGIQVSGFTAVPGPGILWLLLAGALALMAAGRMPRAVPARVAAAPCPGRRRRG